MRSCGIRCTAARHWWALGLVCALIAAVTEPLMAAMLKPLLDRGFTRGQLPLWAIPAAVILLFAIRAVMEERTLMAELPGYADYAARVRHRLIPGVW